MLHTYSINRYAGSPDNNKLHNSFWSTVEYSTVQQYSTDGTVCAYVYLYIIYSKTFQQSMYVCMYSRHI